MGLNPVGMPTSPTRKQLELRKRVLDGSFNGGSPYYNMYQCGYYGVPWEDVVSKCLANGIAIRKKDIDSYNDGAFKRGINGVLANGVPVPHVPAPTPVEDLELSDFPKMPAGWKGTEKRFFPCTADNKPMQKWGWSREYTPELYTRSDAAALSPCGWVGQNMLYQKFIVVDIDGRGHGEDDPEVIAFGERFKSITFAVEDPAKPGSFHLYFKTDRLIPVRHYPWAKLDLMGNAVNAAVYFKNKKWNGVQMMELDDDVWHVIQEYQKNRKERQHVS